MSRSRYGSADLALLLWALAVLVSGLRFRARPSPSRRPASGRRNRRCIRGGPGAWERWPIRFAWSMDSPCPYVSSPARRTAGALRGSRIIATARPNDSMIMTSMSICWSASRGLRWEHGHPGHWRARRPRSQGGVGAGFESGTTGLDNSSTRGVSGKFA